MDVRQAASVRRLSLLAQVAGPLSLARRVGDYDAAWFSGAPPSVDGLG
jgi:hypothetical protein